MAKETTFLIDFLRAEWRVLGRQGFPLGQVQYFYAGIALLAIAHLLVARVLPHGPLVGSGPLD
ncbi:hypothetical protein [Actinomadura litoris]|uniref:Uncharacterized protein n=1 Tax=Actinomadura litoris TaxID=2678616 RepID=A0A7K1KY57_9ACTN|nr:hypothetical protein [Actinomadura litoris]MUN36925.1 hypothetical protein [Actinomadura litoris]